MNRKITKSLALILALAALLSVTAFAAPAETGSALTSERITELQALPRPSRRMLSPTKRQRITSRPVRSPCSMATAAAVKPLPVRTST